MASAQPLTDHDQIREWAEARRARPACVKGTGGKNDTGMLRLDFPGFSGRESLQEISWDEWFRRFDENKLALLVQETTARGQKSNFNKLVGRETASERTGARKRGGAAKPAAATRKSTSARRMATAADRGTSSSRTTKRSGTRTVRLRKASDRRK